MGEQLVTPWTVPTRRHLKNEFLTPPKLQCRPGQDSPESRREGVQLEASWGPGGVWACWADALPPITGADKSVAATKPQVLSVTSDPWFKTSVWAPAAHSQHPTPHPAARREMLQGSWKQSKGCRCRHPCCQVRIEAETAPPGLHLTPAPCTCQPPWTQPARNSRCLKQQGLEVCLNHSCDTCQKAF